jgi:hypothetical protein
MNNEIIKSSYHEIKQAVEDNSTLKVVVYVGIGVVSVYLLGKAFKGLAETIRGFNELKSAINGK